MVGDDALRRELLDRFVDHAFGGTPSQQRDFGVVGPGEAGRIEERQDAVHLRPRRSMIACRLCGSVNSSLMSTPSSSCSSVATTWACPGVPGTARGETPLSSSCSVCIRR